VGEGDRGGRLTAVNIRRALIVALALAATVIGLASSATAATQPILGPKAFPY
jgi:hypothetical protein